MGSVELTLGSGSIELNCRTPSWCHRELLGMGKSRCQCLELKKKKSSSVVQKKSSSEAQQVVAKRVTAMVAAQLGPLFPKAYIIIDCV